jgi:4-hydroxy-tetrahydrodipicolinate synthase
MLNGIVPVLITPMDRHGEIDVSGVKRLIEYLTSYPIAGLWVLGTGGEDMSLSYRQRITVAETVAKYIPENVPSILGCGFFSMRESLDFLKDTASLPYYAYHAMPYHPLLSLERIEWWYGKLADNAPKPLWMYTSANWARFIPPNFVAKMKAHCNIMGVKYSTSNAAHMERVGALADENFQVISAVIRNLYSNLALGIRASTSVEACPFIKPIIKIFELYVSGDHSGALSLQRRLNSFFDEMPITPSQDNFLRVAEGKYILNKKGICETYMSGYYRSLTIQEQRLIDEAADKYADIL